MFMELIPKLTETKAYLLLFLLMTGFSRSNQIEEKNFNDDQTPGDNFPYVIMSGLRYGKDSIIAL